MRELRMSTEHWAGLDGAYEYFAGEDRTPDSAFGVVGWQPIMAGIKERIMGLRSRANTAPARVESGTLATLRIGRK